MGEAHLSERDLARRLIALEAAKDGFPDRNLGEAVRVCENIRAPMSKFMGVAGFRSILSRALVLAKSDAPWLGVVRVGADGILEGLDEVDPGGDEEVGAILVARLLGLPVTFVVPALTLRLVRDGWPDAPWDDIELKIEESS